MMKVLVTGGSGFLGKVVCRQLLESGYDVVAFQRHDSEDLMRMGVKVVCGGLLDREKLKQALAGCEAVIHTAAKAGVWGAKREFEAVNYEGTRLLGELAKASGVRFFVHTSTPSVVFSGEAFQGADETLPYGRNWLCDYARTKADAEKWILRQHHETFRVCALRPHLIWGVGDPHLVPTLVKAGFKKRLKVIGDGNNRVDMTHVENAGEAHLLALESLRQGKAGGEAYFISDGSPVVLWDWVKRLFEMKRVPAISGRVSLSTAYRLGAVCEFIWRIFGRKEVPPMTRFVAVELAKDHWFSIEKAKRDLGYSPSLYSMDILNDGKN